MKITKYFEVQLGNQTDRDALDPSRHLENADGDVPCQKCKFSLSTIQVSQGKEYFWFLFVPYMTIKYSNVTGVLSNMFGIKECSVFKARGHVTVVASTHSLLE